MLKRRCLIIWPKKAMIESKIALSFINALLPTLTKPPKKEISIAGKGNTNRHPS